jgi:hypothetical protein
VFPVSADLLRRRALTRWKPGMRRRGGTGLRTVPYCPRNRLCMIRRSTGKRIVFTPRPRLGCHRGSREVSWWWSVCWGCVGTTRGAVRLPGQGLGSSQYVRCLGSFCPGRGSGFARQPDIPSLGSWRRWSGPLIELTSCWSRSSPRRFWRFRRDTRQMWSYLVHYLEEAERARRLGDHDRWATHCGKVTMYTGQLSTTCLTLLGDRPVWPTEDIG